MRRLASGDGGLFSVLTLEPELEELLGVEKSTNERF
jgi:hypothetical protein